jgi:M6 family metalloprotease-like protein
MKRYILIVLIASLFTLSYSKNFTTIEGDKLIFNRSIQILDEENIPVFEQRIHPQQQILDTIKGSHKPSKTRSGELNNRLLVVLVEFVEEDHPNATSNGKFKLEPDPDFPITLGSPPYDKEYFWWQLEAMKYYYRAVSYEAFQLEFDIFPAQIQNHAYQLPHTLSYYHRPHDPDLFMPRLEQYFTDVWETVRESDDKPVFFGEYGHFMIIHAGANFQNDVRGDSFHDMPSFFINIADGKEVLVDDGQTKIKTSANVPEFVTQDTRSQRVTYVYRDEDGNIVHTETVNLWFGYGLLNSVFAHEFGHSIGFVDLYNTINHRPAVGMFDIMDSGGMGTLMYGEPGDDENIYILSGGFPTLPGVWSRLLAFEQNFLDRGLLVDIADTDINSTMRILASSTQRNTSETVPYFYRIRLSEDEYILIENRNLDPDGDGGTAMKGALDFRIILHPDIFHPTISRFTYEYDLLLPSWVDERNTPVGGGLLVWHIDEKQLNQTTIVDGHTYTNLELNRVNTAWQKYAVRIIEADNLWDLGNPRSRFPRGTEWEYFFRNKPILDGRGTFVEWSSDIHSIELSSTSKPALLTNSGRPSTWKLSNISAADRMMTFDLSNGLWDHSHYLKNVPGLHSLSGMAQMSPQNIIKTVAVSETIMEMFTTNEFEPEMMSYYNQYDDYWWEGIADFDLIATQFDINWNEEFLAVNGSKLTFINQDYTNSWEFDSDIIEPPYYFMRYGSPHLGLVFADSMSVVRFQTSYRNIQCQIVSTSSISGKIVNDSNVLTENGLIYLDTTVDPVYPNPPGSIVVNGKYTKYEPVVFSDPIKSTIFTMTDENVVGYAYWFGSGWRILQVLDLKQYTTEPASQLALGYSNESNSNFILVHTATKVFVFSPDGAMYPGFPYSVPSQFRLKPYTHPYIFRINDEILFLMEEENQGFLAVDIKGRIRLDFSMFWDKSDINPKFFEYADLLYMIYADRENNVYATIKTLSENDKIMWNGFRNGVSGALIRTTEPVISENNKIEMFVYPNPIRSSIASIRILNTDSPAKVNIYNISGQRIYTQHINASLENFRDIRFETKNLSSGMYFVIVNIDGKVYRDKFAIIK